MFSSDKSKSAENHCAIPFSTTMEYFMPVPYHTDTASGAAAIIAPDHVARLIVAHRRAFRLSCSGAAFVSPTACVGLADVSVECWAGRTVAYDGAVYDFDEFRCAALPAARLTAAGASCNGVADGVYRVGFDAARPLSVYKVCFDARARRTLYAWNYVDAPTYHSNQVSTTLPRFVRTEHFRPADMFDLYHPKERNDSKTIEDPSMTVNLVMAKSIGHALIPGHLLIRNQFLYTFEQFATYFYENTVPLWSEFSSGVWKEVERLFLRNLYRFKGKHLIVAGTINSTQLKIPSKKDAQKPFIVEWLGNIPVPISIWRMVYDVQNKRGTVYIGINSPFKRGDPTMHFCEKIACPRRLGQPVINSNLVYCCSKESFEKAYGPLDPVVFEEF